MHIQELFANDEFQAAVRDGLVKENWHPCRGLRIFNYTEKAQYQKSWNPVTLACRGLIVDLRGKIVARPFPKFFNHNEPGAARPDGGPVVVSDKMDGSLGILYPREEARNFLHGGQEYAVATRGSFTSDQAQHATQVYRSRYEWRFTPPAGKTLLFEIIYPENRIVVDYGDQDDLVLLGMVDIETGISYGPRSVPGWPGPRAEVFPYPNLMSALSAPPRPNAEGLVVHFVDSDQRVKIKQEDYVQLHKIVFGLNEHVIWERMRTMKTDSDVFDGIPDEFHEWAAEVADRLFAEGSALDQELGATWCSLEEVGRDGAPRGEFARAIKDKPAWLKSALFSLLDGNPERAQSVIWKQIEPKKNGGPRG